MRAPQAFGGQWTETKLAAIEKYLRAYTTIFNRNQLARYYTTTYVDAFAGTGYMEQRKPKYKDNLVLELLAESEELAKGSARRALDIQPGFDRYMFIEKSLSRSTELLQLKVYYPNQSDKIDVVNDDATAFLHGWLERVDWKQNRALMFLDPFGMQVDWSLLQAIATTEAIDLWLLFPLGIGVGRMLTKNAPPPKKWADKLTRVLGTEDWRSEFYRSTSEQRQSNNLSFDFDVESDDSMVKYADFDHLSAFFVNRLKGVFPGVAENPVALRNSRNSPMYLLCFMTANPKISPRDTAVKIAQDVLRTLT